MDDDLITLKRFKFIMPILPTVLGDDELQDISIPTLFLIGENEVPCSAQEDVNRLNSLAP